MSWTRAVEWLGIASGVAIWTVCLTIVAPSLASSPTGAETAAASRMVDPMFVRDRAPFTYAPVRVEGRVVDTRGRPVAGAVVYVFSKGSPALRADNADRSFVTNRCGRFEVHGLVPGTYSFVSQQGNQATGATDSVPVFEETEGVEIVLDEAPIGA